MKSDLKIAAKNLNLTDPLRDAVAERVEKLEEFYGGIVACRVSLEGPGGHHRGGRIRAKIALTVPRKELVVNRRTSDDPFLAVGSAFDAADRLLEDHVRRLRGYVKVPQGAKVGRVSKIFPFRGYGFLEAAGREIYFHRNSVLAPGFDRLKVGTKVRFSEEAAEEGSQASTVSIMGRSH